MTKTNISTEDTELSQKLYNVLMNEIEPDLLLPNIPTLDEKYKNETEDEKQDRIARYEEAYTKFDESFDIFMGKMKQQVATARHQALEQEETKDRTQEQNTLFSLESAFS